MNTPQFQPGRRVLVMTLCGPEHMATVEAAYGGPPLGFTVYAVRMDAGDFRRRLVTERTMRPMPPDDIEFMPRRFERGHVYDDGEPGILLEEFGPIADLSGKAGVA